MTYLVFETPGLLDLRALTMFGASAKPNSLNPIGHFGTGLKFAVAVLTRLNCAPTIWIGNARYRFVRREVDFRGRGLETIAIEHDKFVFAPNRVDELPFTTELGRDWEAWMAYRELEANTLDEDGRTYLTEDEPTGGSDLTLIVVGDLLVSCHERRDEIFLPGARSDTGPVQVIPAASTALYYRGLKVLDLPKPAVRTWNIWEDQVLTEDRTLKSIFSARIEIARYVMRSDDEALIEAVVTAPPEAWEHDLEFDYSAWTQPNDAFRRIIARRRGKVNEPVLRYYASHEPPGPMPLDRVWHEHPRPWIVDDTEDKIIDANGETVVKSEGSPIPSPLLAKIASLANTAE